MERMARARSDPFLSVRQTQGRKFPNVHRTQRNKEKAVVSEQERVMTFSWNGGLE